MGIPNQQIGWSQKAKLLWQISKQIERLTQVMGGVTFTCPECPECPATINVYSQELSFPINFASMVFSCDGSDVVSSYQYTSESVNNMSELVSLFNSNPGTSAYGTFSASTSTVLKLVTQQVVKDVICPEGTLSINVFND